MFIRLTLAYGNRQKILVNLNNVIKIESRMHADTDLGSKIHYVATGSYRDTDEVRETRSWIEAQIPSGMRVLNLEE